MEYDEYRDESASIYAVVGRIFAALAILSAVVLFLMGAAVLLGMAGA